MAKFLSHDGQDKNGVRAEVMVQTGTGKIKNITNRGKASDDGSYRNVEVEFTPDNPKLQHKVYALLDTTATELWNYIQEAHSANKDISYRIESQRRRAVARDIKFEDLKHSEQVVRVLAAIDNIFSHEAKTTPAEDPDSEAPSALHNNTADSINSRSKNSGVLPLDAIKSARQAHMPASIVDALIAAAILQGEKPEEAIAVGLEGTDANKIDNTTIRGNSRAVEEKPWNEYNTDGRTNPGSYAVAHAATTERFALEHLIKLYSEGKKTNVTVNEDMISQSASIAIELLEIADDVQLDIVGRKDRQKNSYNRALSLVLDAIEKRHNVPIGGDAQVQSEWRGLVLLEATERFKGVLYISEGVTPTAEDIIVSTKDNEEKTSEQPEVTQKNDVGTDVLESSFNATELPTDNEKSQTFTPSVKHPLEGEKSFTPPSAETIERLRIMCAEADVLDSPKLISDWLENNLGVRSARKAHYALVDEFLEFFDTYPSEKLHEIILQGSTSAA